MVGPRFNDEQFAAGVDPAHPGAETEPAGVDAAKQLLNHVGELASFASYYVASKLDATKAQARNLAIMAALGVVGLIVFAAILITAAVLLLNGAALAIGELFESNGWAGPWVGNLIVGALVFVLTGIVTIIVLGKIKSASRQATVEKYEQRKNEQRQKFGHDVSERAVGR